MKIKCEFNGGTVGYRKQSAIGEHSFLATMSLKLMRMRFTTCEFHLENLCCCWWCCVLVRGLVIAASHFSILHFPRLVRGDGGYAGGNIGVLVLPNMGRELVMLPSSLNQQYQELLLLAPKTFLLQLLLYYPL